MKDYAKGFIDGSFNSTKRTSAAYQREIKALRERVAVLETALKQAEKELLWAYDQIGEAGLLLAARNAPPRTAIVPWSGVIRIARRPGNWQFWPAMRVTRLGISGGAASLRSP